MGSTAPLNKNGAFGFDPAVAVGPLQASDAKLARLIDAAGPFDMQLQSTSSIFGALSKAIVYQQLNGKAASSIFGRVCALFPDARKSLTADQILSVSEEELRATGLSRAKLASLQDLAQKTVEGSVPTLAKVRRMENEEIIERLTQVRGIGRWTAEMFLMFRLGRPDILPVGDYGVRNGFAIAYRKRELPTPKDLEKYGLRWKPYRTVASWYLWRAVDLSKE